MRSSGLHGKDGLTLRIPTPPADPCSRDGRDRQAVRRQDLRRAPQALDRRTHPCLAWPLPKAGQGLGASQPQSARLPPPRLHPPHATKTMQSHVKLPDRLLQRRSPMRRLTGEEVARIIVAALSALGRIVRRSRHCRHSFRAIHRPQMNVLRTPHFARDGLHISGRVYRLKENLVSRVAATLDKALGRVFS